MQEGRHTVCAVVSLSVSLVVSSGSQWPEWMFCSESSGSAEMNLYKVLLQNGWWFGFSASGDRAINTRRRNFPASQRLHRGTFLPLRSAWFPSVCTSRSQTPCRRSRPWPLWLSKTGLLYLMTHHFHLGSTVTHCCHTHYIFPLNYVVITRSFLVKIHIFSL